MYPLDWGTIEVKLLDGEKCFVHTLRRPTHEQIFEYERRLQIEVKVDRLPPPEQMMRIVASSPKLQAADEVAAVHLYGQIVVNDDGYDDHQVPAGHKMTAIREGLYNRKIYVVKPSDYDASRNEIKLVEEICTTGQNFTVFHVMRLFDVETAPHFTELLKQRPISVTRNKRGPGWKLGTVPTLKPKMELYRQCLVRIEGAEGDASLVDPLVQRMVVNELLDIHQKIQENSARIPFSEVKKIRDNSCSEFLAL